MPEITEKPADGLPTREPAQKGIGLPGMEAPRLQDWTVTQILQSLKRGRSVIAVFIDNPTSKIKYGRKLQRAAIEEMGETLNTLSGGQWPDTIQWPNGVALALAVQSPEEAFRSTPPVTDIVNVVIPTDWIS
jgi:hypothetical protein